MGKSPNRFLQVMRSRENLSSGENRAGCAERVGVPSGAIFCSTRYIHWSIIGMCLPFAGA